MTSEVGGLTKSMQCLREAVKRQEHHLNNSKKKRDLKENTLLPKQEFFKEVRMIGQLPHERFEKSSEQHFHNNGSEISQTSHWSCNIDSITSSIGEVELALKNNDRKIIRLESENKELKKELAKKDKELKKQKYLLQAEREMFEKYKIDTLIEIKKHHHDESADVMADTPSIEMMKLKSEMAHYRHMYLEISHIEDRLMKQVRSLRDDNTQLKNRLLQQERRSNKFILNMAKRFEMSLKPLYMEVFKRTGTLPPEHTATSMISERNARLAVDNTMLKLELNMMAKRLKLLEKSAKESQIQCLTNRTSICRNTSKEQVPTSGHKKCKDLKSSLSEKSILFTDLQGNNIYSELNVKTSVTSIVERNKKRHLSHENLAQKLTSTYFSKLNVEQGDCSSETFGPTRTESAPELYRNKSEIWYT